MVLNGSGNGFELLWKLSCTSVPVFDTSHQLSIPTWPEQGGLFRYAESIKTHRKLVRHRGQHLSEKQISKMFLTGIAAASPRYGPRAGIMNFLLNGNYPIDPGDGTPSSEWRMDDRFTIDNMALDLELTPSEVTNMNLPPGRRINNISMDGQAPLRTMDEAPAAKAFVPAVHFDPTLNAPNDHHLFGHAACVNRLENDRRPPRRQDSERPKPDPRSTFRRRERCPTYQGICVAC